jgi:hypothetical protein
MTEFSCRGSGRRSGRAERQGERGGLVGATWQRGFNDWEAVRTGTEMTKLQLAQREGERARRSNWNFNCARRRASGPENGRAVSAPPKSPLIKLNPNLNSCKSKDRLWPFALAGSLLHSSKRLLRVSAAYYAPLGHAPTYWPAGWPLYRGRVESTTVNPTSQPAGCSRCVGWPFAYRLRQHC